MPTPQLNINFTPVAGATGYTVCHRPQVTPLPTYECTSVNAVGLTLPIVVTSYNSNSLQYSTNYDVTVQAICDNGLTSSVVSATALKIEPQPPTGFCYDVNLFLEITQVYPGCQIQYTPPGGSLTNVDISVLPYNINNFYQINLCSDTPVIIVNNQGNPITYTTNGSAITGGSVVCTQGSDCGQLMYNMHTNVGLGNGNGACSNQTQTIYSNCPTFGMSHVGCCLYYDSAGQVPVTGMTKFWIDGVLYDLDPTQGCITGYAAGQC